MKENVIFGISLDNVSDYKALSLKINEAGKNVPDAGRIFSQKLGTMIRGGFDEALCAFGLALWHVQFREDKTALFESDVSDVIAVMKARTWGFVPDEEEDEI